MEHIKSPGKTLMKAAGWVFGVPLVLIIILAMLVGNGGMGLQGWHLALLLIFVFPVAAILFIVGLIMHMNFKTKMQIMQAQQAQSSQN